MAVCKIKTVVMIEQRPGWFVAGISDEFALDEVLHLFLEQPLWDVVIVPLGNRLPFYQKEVEAIQLKLQERARAEAMS